MARRGKVSRREVAQADADMSGMMSSSLFNSIERMAEKDAALEAPIESPEAARARREREADDDMRSLGSSMIFRDMDD